MLSRSLMVTSFMTKMLVDIWTVLLSVQTNNNKSSCLCNQLICSLYRQRCVMDVLFQAKLPQVRSLHTENRLLEFIPGSRGSLGCAQSGTWTAARNPPSLALGARMT